MAGDVLDLRIPGLILQSLGMDVELVVEFVIMVCEHLKDWENVGDKRQHLCHSFIVRCERGHVATALSSPHCRSG